MLSYLTVKKNHAFGLIYLQLIQLLKTYREEVLQAGVWVWEGVREEEAESKYE